MFAFIYINNHYVDYHIMTSHSYYLVFTNLPNATKTQFCTLTELTSETLEWRNQVCNDFASNPDAGDPWESILLPKQYDEFNQHNMSNDKLKIKDFIKKFIFGHICSIDDDGIKSCTYYDYYPVTGYDMTCSVDEFLSEMKRYLNTNQITQIKLLDTTVSKNMDWCLPLDYVPANQIYMTRQS